MTANLEKFREVVRGLPLEDFDKARAVIDEEERARREKDQMLQYRLERYKKARKWLDENSEKYMNKWVCLEGDQLIAVDDDGRTVYQKAKEAGIEIPFIHHIVEEPKFYAGGGCERIRD
jgi:hypothetical protein